MSSAGVGTHRAGVPATAASPGRGRSGGGLRDGLHAEWTKLRTLPVTIWLLLAVAVAGAGAGLVAGAVTRCPAAGCHIDPARSSLSGVYLSQVIVAILAVLAVSGEYGSGMIRVTLAAMPRRLGVLAAKAATITAVVLVAGAIGVLGAMLAGQAMLPGHGLTAAHGYPDLSLADGAMLRAAGGTVLYLALIALLSLGIAAAVREAAVAIGAVLGLLYLIPIFSTVVGDPSVHRHLEQIAPMTAGLAIQDTTGLHGLPIGPWPGLGVTAAWAAGALLLGGLLLRLRDA
jgi:ABC-2 type transport system permease protein